MFKKVFSILGCISVLAISHTVYAEGSRYDLPRDYHSEISAAKAYILTNHDRGNKSKDAFSNSVLIDVRRVEEHIAGHPPGAYSIPFPHITSISSYLGYNLTATGTPELCYNPNGCPGGTLPVAGFVSYVEARFPDKSTPILTLCKTGYRSVQAANALAAAGYENVRNIWEGYVGKPKYAYAGDDLVVPQVQLDMDGVPGFTDRDRDGWSGYQELPTSTKLHPGRIFSPYSTLYYN